MPATSRTGNRRTETVRGALVLTTPHGPESYPGLEVVRPGAEWPAILVPRDGLTIVALGGEKAHAYRTPSGGVARGFELRPGDRATRVKSGLQFQLGEWRIERA
jgi:hypothetical protein